MLILPCTTYILPWPRRKISHIPFRCNHVGIALKTSGHHQKFLPGTIMQTTYVLLKPRSVWWGFLLLHSAAHKIRAEHQKPTCGCNSISSFALECGGLVSSLLDICGRAKNGHGRSEAYCAAFVLLRKYGILLTVDWTRTNLESSSWFTVKRMQCMSPTTLKCCEYSFDLNESLFRLCASDDVAASGVEFCMMDYLMLRSPSDWGSQISQRQCMTMRSLLSLFTG